MLSDEEKELIEKIQNGKKIGIYELIRTFKREGIENFITVRRKYIDIMINLIEKQSKEIEQLKEKYIRLQNTEAIQDIYIKKDKIKAKIEELIKEGNYRTADNPNGRVHFQKEITDYQIEILQALIEKE